MSQGARRRIDNKFCKIKYNALKELEKGIAPKDVEYFISYSNFLLLELSITRTIFDSSLGVRVKKSISIK